MNLNDMRANAYGNVKNNDDKKENKEKTVKPFVPSAFIKSSDLVDGKEVKKTQTQATPNVKAFVPKEVIHKSDAYNQFAQMQQTQEKQKQFQQFQPTQFIKTVEDPKTKEELKRQKIFEAEKQISDVTDHLKNGGLVKVPLQQPEDGKDSVYRRIAKFLILIGEEEAAKILPHLKDKQIEKIIPEIASIRSVSSEEAAAIFEEFHLLVEQEKASGGVETARDMLTKAYGKTRAEQMIAKTVPPKYEKPFTYLNDEEKEKIHLLLKDENIGVQTLVLSHLEPQKAASVINMMDAETKKAVVLRLAKMEPMSPELIRRVDAAMKEKALNITTEKSEVVDGRNALAQILKKMDSGRESEIISSLSQEDPDLGDDLKKRLFTLEDVVNADDKFLQEKLHYMKEADIAYLIAGKNQAFVDKILYNISSVRREEVLVQSDILKPMRRADVDEITSKFVAVLRRAYEDGELIIKNRNEEQFV